MSDVIFEEGFRKVARIRLSPGLISETLHMPDGTKIVGAALTEEGDLELTIEHPDLYAQSADVPPPLLYPYVTRQPEKIVWDWKQIPPVRQGYRKGRKA